MMSPVGSGADIATPEAPDAPDAAEGSALLPTATIPLAATVGEQHLCMHGTRTRIGRGAPAQVGEGSRR